MLDGRMPLVQLGDESVPMAFLVVNGSLYKRTHPLVEGLFIPRLVREKTRELRLEGSLSLVTTCQKNWRNYSFGMERLFDDMLILSHINIPQSLLILDVFGVPQQWSG